MEDYNYKEELDKQQIMIDNIRNDLKKSMVPDEKNKHDIVEHVISILSQNKIPAFLFVDIPNPEYDEKDMPCIFQFNNIASIYDYGTEGGLENICTFNESMWYHLFKMILNSPAAIEQGIHKLDISKRETLEEHMKFFNNFVYRCLYNYSQKFYKKNDEV